MRLPSLPIFAKSLIFLGFVSVTLVGSAVYMADRSARQVAEEGVRVLGEEVSRLVAAQIAGAIRFKKVADIEAALTQARDGTDGKLKFASAYNAEGAEILQIGALEQADASIRALVDDALQTGAVQSFGNGFGLVVPATMGADKKVVGVLVLRWSPQNALLKLAVERQRLIAISIALSVGILVLSAALMRFSLTAPLRRVTARTAAMAKGDLAEPVPEFGRGDEIGKTAKALDTLREWLIEGEIVAKDAAFKGAGFGECSAAMVMVDPDLCVTHANGTFEAMAKRHATNFGAKMDGFSAENLIGQRLAIFGRAEVEDQKWLDEQVLPISTDLAFGSGLFAVTVNAVPGADGARAGYVYEFEDVTKSRKNLAILAVLEREQIRADFDENGLLQMMNDKAAEVLGLTNADLGKVKLNSWLVPEDGTDLSQELGAGHAVIGKFVVGQQGQSFNLEGSLSPTEDRSGRHLGVVMLANDITATKRAFDAATEQREELADAQKVVVEALKSALAKMSDGDLSTRLDHQFSGGYEALRGNFNRTLETLDSSVGAILASASTILGEARNIANSADHLSKRTETQAATLEQSAAAVGQLTASVGSAAKSAQETDQVVSDAGRNAETSGEIVGRAVDAMGQISKSSDEISRIIGVIEEIAFQTNLLALNAGVEAARAGDAGRGFAVVASEVRALAQRSSDAAREISDLISTSGEHVKTGVSLVGEAGNALTNIVESVGGISVHVSDIASSTKEQSTGLDEINAAMAQLEEVTQKNVAMFEETTAATQSMMSEAQQLVTVTQKFKTSRCVDGDANHSDTPEKPDAAGPSQTEAKPSHRQQPGKGVEQKTITPKREVLPITNGALALKPSEPDEDSWEEF